MQSLKSRSSSSCSSDFLKAQGFSSRTCTLDLQLHFGEAAALLTRAFIWEVYVQSKKSAFNLLCPASRLLVPLL